MDDNYHFWRFYFSLLYEAKISDDAEFSKQMRKLAMQLLDL